MYARDVAHFLGFVNLLIDEIVVKVNVGGINLGVGIVNAFHTGPVECAQAHGARLTTAIHNAAVELKVAGDGACTPNGVNFGMGCRVIVKRHGVATGRDNLSVFHNHSSEWASSAINVLAGNLAGHLDELAVLFCDGYFFSTHGYGCLSGNQDFLVGL